MNLDLFVSKCPAVKNKWEKKQLRMMWSEYVCWTISVMEKDKHSQEIVKNKSEVTRSRRPCPGESLGHVHLNEFKLSCSSHTLLFMDYIMTNIKVVFGIGIN